jgi:hypothetical protein
MRLGAVLLVALCCAAFAPTASADVRVTFKNGRVTIVASDATVSEILAEWARVGGSTFVDADKIPSRERLTILLEDQEEIAAIDVLLRSVAGYMVAPIDEAPAGQSAVGRVFILPTSTPAPYTPAAALASPVDAGAPARLSAAPPQPDDDGPVRLTAPPPAEQAQAQTPGAPQPLGQASPLLNNTPTQTLPGLGAVTSSQPGVVIGAPAQGRPGRPTSRPTQPARPGGGGGR